MKNLILVLFLTVPFCFLRAQVFSVGDTTCNYIRLDTSLRTTNPGFFGGWSVSSSYGIDVDQDLVNDIVFTKNSTGSNGGSSSWSSAILNCTSSTGFEFVYKSAPTTCYSGSANLLDSLTPSLPLNAALNWKVTQANSWIYNSYYAIMPGSTACGSYYQYGTRRV